MTTIAILPEDLAEHLAVAEEQGFRRALDELKISDRQRWEMLQEQNRMHDLRVRLYAAKLRIRADA